MTPKTGHGAMSGVSTLDSERPRLPARRAGRPLGATIPVSQASALGSEIPTSQIGAQRAEGEYRTPHGERRTYLAGCRCDPCRWSNSRYCKELRFSRDRGERRRVPRELAIARMDELNAAGFSDYAIGKAAGLGTGQTSRIRTHPGPVHVRTLDALLAVTEPGHGYVPADLTRMRLRSLMRLGWTLPEIEGRARLRSLQGGRWRYTEKVSVALATAVRSIYRDLSDKPGPSRHAAGCARSRGYLMPAAWDDPGTLTWPVGWEQDAPEPDPVDEVAVGRFLEGHHVQLTRAEKSLVFSLSDAKKAERDGGGHRVGLGASEPDPLSRSMIAKRLGMSGSAVRRLRESA